MPFMRWILTSGSPCQGVLIEQVAAALSRLSEVTVTDLAEIVKQYVSGVPPDLVQGLVHTLMIAVLQPNVK